MPHQEPPKGYLSVTQVLSMTLDKGFLNYWYGKHGTQLCEQIKKESQDLGKEVHALIEQYFEKVPLMTNTANRADVMVSNFWAKFVTPYQVKPIVLEQTFTDDKLKLQGTLDAVIETKDGVFIADWKTSSQLDPVSVPLQLSAYGYLYNKAHKTLVKDGLAVRIDKVKNTIQVKTYEDLDMIWPIFKAAIKVARYQKFGEV